MYCLLNFRFYQNYVNRRCVLVLQRKINIEGVWHRAYSSNKDDIIDKLDNLDQKIQKIIHQKTLACLETKCKLDDTLLPKCKPGEAVTGVERKVAVQRIPTDCGKPIAPDICIRPYVNPCTPYPVKSCLPHFRTVDPCRDPCFRQKTAQHEERRKLMELSIKAKKILLGLTTLLALIIIYEALTLEERDVVPTGNKRMIRPKEASKSPLFSSDIPSHVPIIIVGGGPAAYSAMKTITSLDEGAKVLLVNKEPYYPYDRTPINTELLTGKPQMARELEFIPQRSQEKKSVFYEDPMFYAPVRSLRDLNQPGNLVSVLRGWTVQKIDTNKKFIELEDGKQITYDKCILATGSSPKELRVFTDNTEEIQERVSTYSTIYDLQLLDKVISYYGPNCTIAVIGGGLNASELACSLRRKGVNVVQVYKEPGNMNELLPRYLSDFVTEKIIKLGVTIFKNAVVQDAVIIKGVEHDQISLRVDCRPDKNYQVLADYVVVSIGNRPNTQLALASNIEIDERNSGFFVNRELQICKDLYAAGDCISYYDNKHGRRHLENYQHAIETGKLAAENLLGEAKTYDTQSMFWADVMPNIGCEAVGVIDPNLSTVGIYLQENKDDKGVEETTHSNTKEGAKDLEDIKKGVVFYLKNQTVVGVLTWNVFGRAPLIKRILQKDVTYNDVDDIAKFLNLHI